MGCPGMGCPGTLRRTEPRRGWAGGQGLRDAHMQQLGRVMCRCVSKGAASVTFGRMLSLCARHSVQGARRRARQRPLLWRVFGDVLLVCARH